MKAAYGWTVVKRQGLREWVSYKRDCPVGVDSFSADLAATTYTTRCEARSVCDLFNAMSRPFNLPRKMGC